MLVILLGSFAVALAFAPVLIDPEHGPKKVEKNARYVTIPGGALCLILVSVFCIYFIIKKASWKANGTVKFIENRDRNPHSPSRRRFDHLYGERHQRSPQGTRSKAHHEMPVLQIIVFGIGAGLFMLCNLIQTILFEAEDPYWEWVNLLVAILYIPAIVIQIYFFIKYNGAILPNWPLFHYSIALMMADKLWVWLTVTLNDITYILSDDNVNNSSLDNATKSKLEIAVETSLVLVQPFFVEFLTVSMGILVLLWNDIGKCRRTEEDSNTGMESVTSPGGGHDDYAYVINSEQEDHITVNNASDELPFDFEQRDLLGTGANQSTERSFVSEKIKTGLFTAFAVVFAILLLLRAFILDHFFPFEHVADLLSDKTEYILSYGLVIGVYSAALIACKITTHKIYPTEDLLLTSFSSSEYLLVLSAASHFIFFIFRVIAGTTFLSMHSTDTIHRSEAICLIFYATVAVVQVWAQTQLLLAAKMDRTRSKLTRYCLIFIAAINIARWLSLAIGRESYKQGNSKYSSYFLDECFGLETSGSLVYLLFPAMELYRFHSAVIAYEILS